MYRDIIACGSLRNRGWFLEDVGMHVLFGCEFFVGHESLPLGVEDGCQGGLGCNLVEAAGLLVGVLIAELAELFLVVAPRHVVLAPMPGTSLDLLLVSFSFLGRCLLPVLISLLFLLVSIVLLVLLFLLCLLHLASCLLPCCHLWFQLLS